MQEHLRLGINKGTAGNISARFGNGFLISPTGVAYDKLTPEMVVAMNWDATFEGDVQPSSEWRFHRDILRHAPISMQWYILTPRTPRLSQSLGKDIPAIHYAIASAGGPDIRRAPYEIFGSQELADGVVAALSGRRACLMAHHGVVTAHVSVARALALAVSVEELAHQYLTLLPLGEPPRLSQAQIADVLVKFKTYGQQPQRVVERLRQAT